MRILFQELSTTQNKFVLFFLVLEGELFLDIFKMSKNYIYQHLDITHRKFNRKIKKEKAKLQQGFNHAD